MEGAGAGAGAWFDPDDPGLNENEGRAGRSFVMVTESGLCVSSGSCAGKTNGGLGRGVDMV